MNILPFEINKVEISWPKSGFRKKHFTESTAVHLADNSLE